MTAVDVDTTAQDAAWWAMRVPCVSEDGHDATHSAMGQCGCAHLMCDDCVAYSRRHVAHLIAGGYGGTCQSCGEPCPPESITWRPL